MLSEAREFWIRGGFNEPKPGEKPLLCKLGWHIVYEWNPMHGREMQQFGGSCGRRQCDRKYH